ncbi:hypothetical protein B566_EDAN013919 [Ephemera danica]|nr:hypothetical protein B566_EDAN013919 [Ephemera danica]
MYKKCSLCGAQETEKQLKTMASLRHEVLRCYKALHRTRKFIFSDDHKALAACRQKIYDEFQKNKNVSDEAAINEMIKFAYAVEQELRTAVVQAKETEPGQFAMRITEHTRKLDNVPYKDCGPSYRENQCANPEDCRCKGAGI